MMHKGRKGLSTLSLLYLSAILALTGCQDRASELLTLPVKAHEPVKLSFWTPFSGGDGSFMLNLVNQFNEEHQGRIHVDLTNNNSDEYYIRLPTAIVTNEAPDIAIVHASRFAQYVPAQFLQNIDKSAEDAQVNWSEFNPNVLKNTIVEGQHYAIPLDTHLDVMYYNKKWLQTAGLLNADGTIHLQSGEQNFTDFLETLQKNLPEGVAPLAMPNIRSDAYWLWWSLYNQMDGGGQMYTPEGNAAVVDNPNALKALHYVNSLYKSKLIPPGISDSLSLFTEGKAALLILGVWATGAMENEANLDFGVAPIPQIYDHPATWGDSHTMAFPVHTKQDPEKLVAAIQFADWISQHGSSWAKAGHIPANLKALQSPEFSALRFVPGYAEEVKHVAYLPNHPFQGKINDLFVAEFEKMLRGTQSPDEVLQHLQDQINRHIQDHFEE